MSFDVESYRGPDLTSLFSQVRATSGESEHSNPTAAPGLLHCDAAQLFTPHIRQIKSVQHNQQPIPNTLQGPALVSLPDSVNSTIAGRNMRQWPLSTPCPEVGLDNALIWNC